MKIRYLLSLVAVSSLAFTNQSFAQDASSDVEEVVTTGSRIARPETATSAPVTVVDAAAIKASGLTDLGEVLRRISATQGSTATLSTNNGGSGGVKYSLRGIGTARTLVLLNGRRVVPSGNGAAAAPDLSHIPTAMVERIEILKDGASAIYGSDAMAGVVNIITKKSNDGVTLEYYSSNSQDTNAAVEQVDLVVGVDGAKGSTVFGFSTTDQTAAFMAEQPWANFEVWAPAYFANDEDRVDGSNCALACYPGGSSAPPWGRYDGVTLGPDYSGYKAYGNFAAYNYNPVNYLRTPQEKYSFTMNNTYEIMDGITFFSEMLYSKTESQRLIAFEPLAPSAFFGYPDATYSADNYYNRTFGPRYTDTPTLDADGNPVLDADGNPTSSLVLDANGLITSDIVDWRRRMVEGGGRRDDRDTDVYRFVMGLEGTLENGYNWSVFYNYGKNDAESIAAGYYNLDKVADAVGPTYTDANGVLKCGVDADTSISSDCVPLNVFGENSVTPEMLKYISGDWNSYTMGANKQKNYGANISGDIAAVEGLAFAAGYEYREDSGSTLNDALILQGITTAGTSQNTAGSYEVDDLYAEFLYVTGNLELSLATRYSDYSTFGDTTNSEFGAQYTLNDMVTLRGTFSESFRAPSVPDLYGGTFLSYPTADDACDDLTVLDANGDAAADQPATAEAPAACQAQGVPAFGFVSSVVQVPTLYGGNANVQPESSESYTLGAVLNPNDSVTVTVDYWNIEIDNAIGTVGTTDLIDFCVTQGLFCDKTERYGAGTGVLQGQIIKVIDTNDNVGTETYSGVDLAVIADLPSVYGGDLSLDVQATYNEETQVITGYGNVIENLAGTNSYDYGMYTRWRAMSSLNWNKDNLSVQVMNRYIHGYTDKVDDFWVLEPVYTEIDAVIYTDVRATLTTDEYGTHTFGVNNLLDTEVPFVPSAFSANTDVENYDLLGPVMFYRFSYNF